MTERMGADEERDELARLLDESLGRERELEARPSLSLSQIDALICLVRGDQPDDVDGGPWEMTDAPYELVLTLRAMRTEMTKETNE